jgi:hypothetical protein
MTDAPLVPGPLYGLRTWRVVVANGRELLAAPHRGTTWPTGGAWLEAACTRTYHAAPQCDCDCGVHAWHPHRAFARRVLGIRRELPGIVEAEGAVEVHQDGFRAERARPYALVLAPGRNAKQIDRLAQAYQVPVIEVSGSDELLAWCGERGLGLDPVVVANLLGPQPAVERRRGARKNALRLAAAVAVGALLVAAGLVFIGDSPDHDLYGRSGKVEVRNP